jgi:hypothetical protein
VAITKKIWINQSRGGDYKKKWINQSQGGDLKKNGLTYQSDEDMD